MGCGASLARSHEKYSDDSGVKELPVPPPPPACDTCAEKKGLEHLRSLRPSALKELAKVEDAPAALQCLERRDLEGLLISRLGTEEANKRAYNSRIDVQESRQVAVILGRVMHQAEALAEAVSEDQRLLERSLKAELDADSPTPAVCDRLSNAVGVATDHSLAIGSVLAETRAEIDVLSRELDRGYEDSDCKPIKPVDDIVERVARLLQMLAPATLALADLGAQSEPEPQPVPLALEDQGARTLALQALARGESVGEAPRSASSLAASTVGEAERRALLERQLAAMSRTMDLIEEEREVQQLLLMQRRAQRRARGGGG
eukprot:TRINITY_DN76389_c0_g1_i1.p1 TRINITY_DN76389_c0_g1~~TRINITY_DN76389_c0_g1_i1.p1  ORF type:complete len:318 (+),score=88.80 TRINITY_DN76389_c0_g1_i1:167-1120(+)